jgi:3-phenylpropionate/cinnamic acid dioxygenase small subunit
MSDSVKQISDMIFRYAELFDTGRFDEFAALFAHGRWHRAEPGAAAARQWITDNVWLYDGLTRTKHVTTNVIIDVDEEAGTATASSYVTIFQALPDFPLQPIFSGRYADRLTRTADGWHWTERQVINDLYGDISRHVRYAPPGGAG